MLKTASKTKSKPAPAADSDSDSLANDSSGDEFMSDEEYPMSEEEMEFGDGAGDAPDDGDQSGEPTKWAKAMAKFLRKATDDSILSKAATDEQKERKKKQSKEHAFDVVSAEGAVKKETGSTNGEQTEDKPNDLKLAKELLRQRAALKKLRQKDILGLRVRPSIHDYERERTLRKVATKGTVQLFNAVRQQQKEVNRKLEEAGKLEYKREKVLKSLNRKEFLDVLMNGPRAKSELVDNLVKKEEEDDIKSEVDSEDEPKSTWGALRADFLTGKKSGWDKEDDQEAPKVPDDLDDGMGSGSDME